MLRVVHLSKARLDEVGWRRPDEDDNESDTWFYRPPTSTLMSRYRSQVNHRIGREHNGIQSQSRILDNGRVGCEKIGITTRDCNNNALTSG